MLIQAATFEQNPICCAISLVLQVVDRAYLREVILATAVVMLIPLPLRSPPVGNRWARALPPPDARPPRIHLLRDM